MAQNSLSCNNSLYNHSLHHRLKLFSLPGTAIINDDSQYIGNDDQITLSYYDIKSHHSGDDVARSRPLICTRTLFHQRRLFVPTSYLYRLDSELLLPAPFSV